MSGKTEEVYIKVQFGEKDKATFDIYTTNDAQILTAIAGLEGYIAARAGLSVDDIRELIDESKKGLTVRPNKSGVKK